MDKKNVFLNNVNTMNHELNNCTSFYNPNWENSSMDHHHKNDPFESNIVSSINNSSNFGDNFVLRELIGKLGSICNSGEISPNSFVDSNNNSCYTTPLNSPPRLNLSNFDHHFPTSSTHFSADLGFVDRASKLSCNNWGGTNESEFVNKQFQNLESCKLSRNKYIIESEFGDSRENSAVSEQIPVEEIGIKCQNDANFKKGKSVPKRKAKEIIAKNDNVLTQNNESSSKRRKSDEKNGSEENQKPQEPSKDYIHVRARRGQATDAHSLAERVRREKIGERMKFLQDLVPGCNKVTGKAVMLDEIINYVQSLQCQVEFLSMKLANLNPTTDFNTESLPSKNMFQSVGSSHHNMNSSETSVQEFPYGFQSQQGQNLQSFLPKETEFPFRINPNLDGFVEQTSQVPTFFEDDLHSFIHMGFGQIQAQNFPGNMTTTQMKVEL